MATRSFAALFTGMRHERPWTIRTRPVAATGHVLLVRNLAELDRDRAVLHRDERPLRERAEDGRIGMAVPGQADAAGIDVERVADPARPLQVRVPAREKRRVVAEIRLDRRAV